MPMRKAISVLGRRPTAIGLAMTIGLLLLFGFECKSLAQAANAWESVITVQDTSTSAGVVDFAFQPVGVGRQRISVNVANGRTNEQVARAIQAQFIKDIGANYDVTCKRGREQGGKYWKVYIRARTGGLRFDLRMTGKTVGGTAIEVRRVS